MSRKLIAALACRAGGTRLYGKPLQNLEPDHSILDQIVDAISATPEISTAVLGISEGIENLTFADFAKRHGLAYIWGGERDVLWRLILCGRAAAATDVFRITTECPFTAWDLVAEAWRRHVDEGNDITVTDLLPHGCHFEIYRLDALEKSHAEGNDAERSEYCSAYARRRHDLFKIGFVAPPPTWRRMDRRLTVDYPEDLVLCRQVYTALKDKGPRIPMSDIIEWLDTHQNQAELVSPYISYSQPFWSCAIPANLE